MVATLAGGCNYDDGGNGGCDVDPTTIARTVDSLDLLVGRLTDVRQRHKLTNRKIEQW